MWRANKAPVRALDVHRLKPVPPSFNELTLLGSTGCSLCEPFSARMRPTRGSALLAVLWLTAALSAIAFTVATTVRAETERTSTAADALKTYYLATGAIDRALLYMQWGPGYRNPDGSPKYFENPTPLMRFQFPSGSAIAELIPESAKLNVNTAPPNELAALLSALGVPSDQATVITQGIVDWRTPTPGGSFTRFDQFYMSLTPSFRARHASFQEIEELLLVQGVTPDLFYGRYASDGQGTLVRHAGLRDCLSVYGSLGGIDINTAEAAVMQAIGLSAANAAGIVAARRTNPIRDIGQVQNFRTGPGSDRLSIVPNMYLTIRATARLRLANGAYSDLERTVSALVCFLPADQFNPPYHIMRWYDNTPSLQ